jgi:non-canonical (house-cleaning) NTP pyrophosphatase
MLTIALGTKPGNIKHHALIDAVNMWGRASDILCVEQGSGVPDQPFGLHETTDGAKNRAVGSNYWSSRGVTKPQRDWQQDTSKPAAKMSFGVGAENGVVEYVPGSFMDLAVILMYFEDHDYIVAMSEGIKFPTKYVYECMARRANGEASLTVGRVIAEHNPGVDHADPHSFLTGGRLGRREILTRAFYAALVQIPQEWLSYTNEWHAI